MFKWLCYFRHNWQYAGGTIYTNVNWSKTKWKCKRCGETFEEFNYPDI